MLVHICCSVDSHFFLQKLQKLYPDATLKGFFYDPNIHPYSEYRLRLLDVQRSCNKLGIELLEGEYDYEGWLSAVKGFEAEPEKGARCDICFDNRLETTAKMAVELGEKTITTTLLTSPKKSMEQLRAAAEDVEKRYALEVVTPDFRSGGGTQEQFALAKKDGLYHQDYCGCLFALTAQRDNQERLADELISPLGQQIQPESIEYRIELYQQIMEKEAKEESVNVRREKFLNYRLMRAFVRQNKEVVPSYFLFYSTLKRRFTRGKIETNTNGIAPMNREEILFISLEKFNALANTSYESVKSMIFNPPSVEKELEIRRYFQGEFLSLSPLVILDNIDSSKVEVFCESHTYHDVRELLATF